MRLGSILQTETLRSMRSRVRGPGILGPKCGQAPVEIRMVSARTRVPVASRTVWASSSTARLLTSCDLVAFERRGVGGFQPRHLTIDVRDQRRPVECRLRHGPAVTGGVFEFLGKSRRVDQQLLRHAAADHAGAADAIFLSDHHARAVARRNPPSAYAARARTNDKEIDVVIRHQPLSPVRNLCRSSTGQALCQRLCPRFFSSSRIFGTTSSDSLFAQSCANFMLESTTFGCRSSSFLPAGDW